jgi:hypothetical protein
VVEDVGAVLEVAAGADAVGFVVGADVVVPVAVVD